MATINLSLNDTLKNQMERLSGLNWSKVAAAAFEAEVKARMVDADEMSAAVERLMASRAQHGRAAGIEAGKTWAMKEADWPTLAAVSELDEGDASDCERLAQVAFGGPYGDAASAPFCLAERIDPAGRATSNPFVEAKSGFIVGARMVKELADAAADKADKPAS